MATDKKLIGPYSIRIDSERAFSTMDDLDLDEAANNAAQQVARWKYAGYVQVKEGAYRFSQGNRSYALKVFNANNKLVTQEVLEYFEKKIKIKEGRK
jgi:hypothetical protein